MALFFLAKIKTLINRKDADGGVSLFLGKGKMILNKNVKLRNALFLSDITQAQLAGTTGVPRQYISSHINGRWIFPDEEKNLIAKALQMPVEQLFDHVAQS